MKTTARPPEYHPKNIPALLDMLTATTHDGPAIDASLRKLEALLVKKRQRSVRGLVVAIVGSSRAGKSTLARRIQSSLRKIDSGTLCQIVAQDSFKKRTSNVPDVNGKTTWEHEDFTDWEALMRHIDTSKASNDFVIVEGYLLCLAEDLASRVDVWVNVQSTIEQCRARRTSYPTVDNYGSRGWADSNAYVDGCIWPKHCEHMSKIPTDAIALSADSSTDARSTRVIEALQKL
jgi:ABC-type dipeptide/oligopeptide/nickel transport system ATPase component